MMIRHLVELVKFYKDRSVRNNRYKPFPDLSDVRMRTVRYIRIPTRRARRAGGKKGSEKESMGVPSFFRWVALRYPRCVSNIRHDMLDEHGEEDAVDNFYIVR